MAGRFLEVNDAYVAQSGFSQEELLAMRIPDIEAAEQPEETAAHIERVMEVGHDRFRSSHRRKDGTVWLVEVVTTYSPIRGGRLFVFVEDITAKAAQESRLELASRVLDTMEQAVVITDAGNRSVSMNPAATRITGYGLEEVRGKAPRVFASGHHDRAFYAAMWQALNTSGHWEGGIWDRRKDGAVYAKWMTVTVVNDPQGSVSQYVSVFSDITDRKRNEEIIWRQANFDSLTGLPNRHLLHERLERALKAAHGNGTPLAVFFIDLDNFKQVNDTLGHAKGDDLLVEAARRIAEQVRDTDTIARLGGDEFTVILPDCGGYEDLERVARKLLRALDEPFRLAGSDETHVSGSIGIALYPMDAGDSQTLLKHADQAMYAAKRGGRNRVVYFTRSMQEEADNRQSLTGDLRHALERRQLQVYYQPIIALGSGEIAKAEALLRWHHLLRGVVAPGAFIPLAEESGLIHEIGDWVFREAIAAVKAWQERFGRRIQVGVNKSPVQFDRVIAPSWHDLLTEQGLPGECINVEITEGSLLKESHHIQDRLLEFRDAGIEVSIDDFGTGVSALSYLHRFDIDYLKVDRSFVSELGRDSTSTALTEAIIAMAHKLGIKAVAEGVESERQHELLVRFGCDYAQGFLYSHPLPADEFARLLEKGRSLAPVAVTAR